MELNLEQTIIKKCVICGQPAENCHIRTRGAGGTDLDWNIYHACRKHHTEQHSYGFWIFCKKYPVMLKVLSEKGWRFIFFRGVNKLTRN